MLTVDIGDMRRRVDDLFRNGVTGIIVLGKIGENNALTQDEKIAVLTAPAV